MKLVELNTIFDIKYGNQFDSYKLETDEWSDINFVSRTSNNLGVSSKVSKYNDTEPHPAGLITVALGGSVLSSFIQQEKFYTGQNIKILTPKNVMSFTEKVYYCLAIERNKFRYVACGREANVTLDTLLVPDSLPSDFKNITLDEISMPSSDSIIKRKLELHSENWRWYGIQELFEIKKGKRLTKADMIEGTTPFIGAIDSNNGYREYIGQEPIHSGNTITVNYNGNGVAESYYQPKPFWASDDVNVLYPKFVMNPYNALFITTIIRTEKYRFNYGRKWHMERMNTSKIKLPSTINKQPDFEFMENFIKSLPYSNSI